MAARNPMMVGKRIALMALLQVAAASSVLADGAGSAVQWPIPGRPAVVAADGVLEVGLRETGSLALAGGGLTHPLAVEFGAPEGGVTLGAAPLPDGLSAGTYDLIFRGGRGDETQPGVVHIVPAFPAAYSVALVRAAAFTADGVEVDAMVASLRERLAPAGVSLAFLLGPLAGGDQSDGYKMLRDALAVLRLPVFVCPSEADLLSPQCVANFGRPPYAMTFGADGYLLLGGGLPASDPRTSGALGEAYLARRILRPCRWSTGVAARYGLDWALRGQIALFVDDPLDYLIAAEAPPTLGDTVPWGTTRLVPSPAIPRGTLLILEVDVGGVRMRQTAG